MADWDRHSGGSRWWHAEPSCVWVRGRLSAYLCCDAALSDPDYARIDAHLAACPACAETFLEQQDLMEAVSEALCPEACLPQIDGDAVAARILSGEAASLFPALQEMPLLPETHPLIRGPLPKALEAGGKPPGKAEERKALPRTAARAKRYRFLRPALAAALLLVVFSPVLVYAGIRTWKALTATGSGAARQTQNVESAAAANRPIILSKARAEGRGGAPANGHSSQAAVSDAAGPSDTLDKSIDQLTQEAVIRAEVEAMLPHTDEEYEAWAREEYPHIMWLYDVLMGKTPKKPVDSPAGRMVSFGVDKDGNPTITLPNAEGHPETFTFPIPSGHNPGEPLWDGIPVNIPDWAQKLYADTPENQRPSGWRALLIYSGEIFKFDCPRDTTEPSVHPIIDATRKATLAARRTYASSDAFCDVIIPERPEDYLNTLAPDNALIADALHYIATSCRLMGTAPFENLADNTTATQAAILDTRNPECAVHTRLQLLSTLFDSREDRLRQMKTR